MMLLVKRNQDLMPSLFNELMDWNTSLMAENMSTPQMNVSESEGDYELEFSVPGLRKDELSLTIDTDNNLVVEMVKKEERKNEGRRYLRREFMTSQFRQLVALPENVKRELISARVEDGILRVTMPKISEEEKRAQVQTIAIG